MEYKNNFKKNLYFKFIIFFLIIYLLSFLTFHFLIHLSFRDLYGGFLILPNLVGDENLYYFSRLFYIKEFINFDYNLFGFDRIFFFLKDFITTLIILLTSYFIEFKVLNVFFDFFQILANLLLYKYFFHKIFKYEFFFSLFSAVLLVSTFAVGPLSIQNYLNLFINFEYYTNLPDLLRTSPPGLTNLFFLFLMIVFQKIYIDNNKLSKYYYLAPIFIFTYYANAIILAFSFCLFLFYKFIKQKKISLNYFDVLTSICFLIYIILIINIYLSFHFYETVDVQSFKINELKFVLLNIFFLFLNTALINSNNIQSRSKKNCLFLNIFGLAIILSFLFMFLFQQSSSMSNWDYYAKPFQWLVLINIVYNKVDFLKKKIKFILPLMIIFFTYFIYSISIKDFHQNNNNIVDQISYINSIKKIKTYIKRNNIISFNPFFVNYYSKYLNSKSYIISYSDYRFNNDYRLQRFIESVNLLNIKDEDRLLLLKKPHYLSNEKYPNGIMENILFGLSKFEDNKKINFLKKEISKHEKQIKLKDNNIFFLLDKKNFNLNFNITKKNEIMYEDNNIVLYKIYIN